MENQEIIEKIYKLQLLLRDKNALIANALEKATIPLIEYEKELKSASRQDLLKIKGIGEASASLVMQVIEGKHVYEIATNVQKPKRKPKWE